MRIHAPSARASFPIGQGCRLSGLLIDPRIERDSERESCCIKPTAAGPCPFPDATEQTGVELSTDNGSRFCEDRYSRTQSGCDADMQSPLYLADHIPVST